MLPLVHSDFVIDEELIKGLIESESLSPEEVIIDHFASEFYRFSAKELSRLRKETLHSLLCSRSLKIMSEDLLFDVLTELGSDYREYWKYINLCFMSCSGISRFADGLIFEEITSDIWRQILCRLKCDYYGAIEVDRHCLKSISKILMTLPNALKEMGKKTWELVYRGSDDGFRSSDFHRKCNKKSNTVTIIETTEGFIFGGFTRVMWESREAYKPDESSTSFLFSVKNPHKRDFGRLGLKDSRYAIHCHPSSGPTFGNGHDIHVADNCNVNTNSYTRLGHGYMNNTDIEESEFFSGSKNFKVAEIEVFTIID
jgi:hypothetical protein